MLNGNLRHCWGGSFPTGHRGDVTNSYTRFFPCGARYPSAFVFACWNGHQDEVLVQPLFVLSVQCARRVWVVLCRDRVLPCEVSEEGQTVFDYSPRSTGRSGEQFLFYCAQTIPCDMVRRRREDGHGRWRLMFIPWGPSSICLGRMHATCCVLGQITHAPSSSEFENDSKCAPLVIIFTHASLLHLQR